MGLSREFFDALIVGVIVVGLALAAVRLYRDFTRPLPPSPLDRPPAAYPQPEEQDRKTP